MSLVGELGEGGNNGCFRGKCIHKAERIGMFENLPAVPHESSMTMFGPEPEGRELVKFAFCEDALCSFPLKPH